MSDQDRLLDQRAEQGEHYFAAIDAYKAYVAENGPYSGGKEDCEARYHLGRAATRARTWVDYRRLERPVRTYGDD